MLAGGGALIVHGIVDRATTDLDFFFPDTADVRPTAQAALSVLQGAGFRVDVVRDGATFVRLNVRDGHDEAAIDFGLSRRVFPPAQTESGQVLAPEDLAGDKMAALFSRAEARDFVDVFALSAHFSREELYALAREKDTGFDLGHLHDSLGMFDHRTRQDFPLNDEDFERLRTWVHDWRGQLPHPTAPLHSDRGPASEE
ncbi:nucleotidyl transferase AbiEii/AbiGii toxin family protein [Candidatus Poriferisodalis sp.]|uniref:nucleotidyl transferase AbiEii/AbiGii toxin family protein n=1 Tax=Candidatus Poriferisodalis sp. TaxID=3101277 RepID=UPI003B027ABF